MARLSGLSLAHTFDLRPGPRPFRGATDMSIDHVEPEATPAVLDAPAPSPPEIPNALRRRPERGDHWYRRNVLRIDVLAIAVALGATLIVRFAISGELRHLDVAVAGFLVMMASLWLASLAVVGAYDSRRIGVGTEEYKRVAGATAIAFGLVATTSFLANADMSRIFVAVAMPVGLVLLLVGRRSCRAVFHRLRAQGQHLAPTLVIGADSQRARLTHALDSSPVAGFRVVAHMPLPTATEGSRDDWFAAVSRTIEEQRIEAVAVAQGSEADPQFIRELAWRLEDPRVGLLVDPGIADIAGPRLSIRPAADLALVHLDEPQLTGPKRAIKRSMDIVGASLALMLLTPVMLVLCILVRCTSRGPVVFTQTRIGQHGEPFRLFKFRTMVADAQERQDEVWSASDAANKAKSDPRVTRVGRPMRRWSLDELPQFVNVLNGSMSLVGPRPIQVVEADTLQAWQGRRHLTKPGLTGLWQISGRSETTWDERMRLDLKYVENWSPSLDLIIALKTIRVVLSGNGAY